VLNKYYTFMLIPIQGTVRQTRLRRMTVLLVCLLLFSLLSLSAVAVWGLYHWSGQQAQWQQEKHDYQQTIQHLHTQEQQSKQQLHVYARTLAQLQTRALRLHSLGESLAAQYDIAPFPDAAIGGLQAQHAEAMSTEVFDHALQQLKDAFLYSDTQFNAMREQHYEEQSLALARPHFWPTRGGWLSSHFGQRIDPFTGKLAYHHGVDIANHLHDPVLAAGSGVVVFAGYAHGYGQMIELDHGFGYKSRYGHLSQIKVKRGDHVSGQQVIGAIGSTGRSTGAHLHYEVWVHGYQRNPQHFLPRKHS